MIRIYAIVCVIFVFLTPVVRAYAQEIYFPLGYQSTRVITTEHLAQGSKKSGQEYKDYYLANKTHLGTDYRANVGDEVYATVDGKIVYWQTKTKRTGEQDGWNSFVVIRSDSTGDEHIIGHISCDYCAESGGITPDSPFSSDKALVVKRGEMLGKIIPLKDGTPHLHWSINSKGIVNQDGGLVPSVNKDGNWGQRYGDEPIVRSTAADQGWVDVEAMLAKGQLSVPTDAPTALQAQYNPGGISLSRAAAEEMALNISLEGAYFEGDFIVLAGRSSSSEIDAAIFLTAMRLACSQDDPYFSLDPPDFSAWSSQSRLAMDALWSHVKERFDGRNGKSGLFTISARRDVPEFWQKNSPRFPDLKSKLVFHPDWLSQTRFGEILYKADVLLKELAVGAPVVRPDTRFRADEIPGYLSAAEDTVRRLLEEPNGNAISGANRLWFDLMPKGDRAREVRDISFFVNGNSLDLSAVYPQMFVRRQQDGQDVPGSSPSLDRLAGDLNSRTAIYADAYQELNKLTDVFRAYIAAVRVAKSSVVVCPSIRSSALLEAEKLKTKLPAYHEAELFLTVARQNTNRSMKVVSSSSVSGGVSLQGKKFYSSAAVSRDTDFLRELRSDIVGNIGSGAWTGRSGRRYIAFNLDSRDPVRRAPIVAKKVH